MITYCPPNATLSHPWVNDGINLCFYQTIYFGVLGCFIVIFGLLQLRLYRKYATRHGNNVVLRKSWFYNLQLFAHFGLTSLTIFNIVLRHSIEDKPDIFGYEILGLIVNLVAWPLCVVLIYIERHYQLPHSPSHGHGAVLLLTWTIALIAQALNLLSIHNRDWFFNLKTLGDKIEFGFWVTRLSLTLCVFGLGLKAPGISQTIDYLRQEDEEAIFPNNRQSASDGSTWRGFWKKLMTLLPYMWPKKSIGLQFRVVVCLLLLAGVRVANVFVPLFSKKIVDALSPIASGKYPEFCWDLILIYVLLKFLQGGGTGGQGLLNYIRTLLWIKVQQYTSREIMVGLFTHLHSLSLRWHLSRKTGEVLRIMDRGTSSINGLLSYLIFNILPTLMDIIIAVVYFTTAFNIWFGLIVFVTMAVYLACTIVTTEWRTKYRRRMNLADNEQRTKSVDSLLNFETVKYYGAEQYEINRYQSAILDYQSEEWKSLASLALLNCVQSVIMNLGLLTGSLYCGYLVSQGQLTVGDYVLFGTYILQLMVPLNFLGTLYRAIQESFVNMENMLDLMDEPQEIKDLPNALSMSCEEGNIEFKNVTFYYAPERTILKDITFTAKPGDTIAFVGATGSGKSTIIRLLFRFYDVTEGEILIDGQNLKNVTQESLRKAIGVVPQDTVLFNDTISYNIEYGRQGSAPDEVETAARNADIHQRILSFPDEYETKVGERGLKLSGGEKQRVAIARTLLKAPKIVLLDEATSALDTQTERNIQQALDSVCENRTTIIVAHRLSTITHADCIMVLHEGEIVERGRHEDLIKEQGKYWEMWNQQSKTKEDKKEQ